MDLNYIVIEGNIGAGKTSLCQMMKGDLSANLILEQFVDNPFLPKFYKDPERYSFQLELSFLAERSQQLTRELISRNLFNSITIADYYYKKSLIFAKETLKDDEYNLYRQIFNILYKSIPPPDLYVYLHVDVEKLLSNILKRGREYEMGITADYLSKIQKGYFNFFKQQNDISILILDINKVDFIENQKDYNKIRDIVLTKKYKRGITMISI